MRHLALPVYCAVVVGLRRNWPAFREEMRQRSAERARTPLPADDTH